MNTPDKTYWQRKLAALFHDSPEKGLDIKDHWSRAKALSTSYCYSEGSDYFNHGSDHQASAADRIPFPLKQYSIFDGTTHPFKHPLGGCVYNFQTAGKEAFKTAEEALDVSFTQRIDLMQGDERSAFFALWRCWQNWSADTDLRFNFLPAETRLPDHSIWNHLNFTTALEGCNALSGNKGAELLIFTIGPVQDFIAAARSTRDLWSGSYLLSYLIATVMRDVALKFGPDHIISPNLRGQPLIDLLLCDEIWSKAKTNKNKTIAESLELFQDSPGLLTPSLPNRFLALIPQGQGKTIAKELEKNLRKTFKAIADSVKETIKNEDDLSFNEELFDKQVSQALEVYWQCLEIPQTYEDAETLIKNLPETNESIQSLMHIIEKTPNEVRDKRNFKDKKVEPGIPSQPTAAWAGLTAVAGWLLAGTKNTRTYDAWAKRSGWNYGKENNKDILNGKEETVILPPNEDMDLCEVPKAIKEDEFLGASTLIKRFWHQTWLKQKHKIGEDGFKTQDFGMPNTYAIAQGKPFEKNSHVDPEDGYFAILALDGDEMGKWLSGAKTPELREVLSQEMIDYFNQQGADLEKKRPLNPSFHLQFSEMLGNFALRMVRFIVQAHKGRLIYAGGDDVLAMLPADEALDCARDLRAAFRGEKDILNQIKGFWWPIQQRESIHMDCCEETALFDCKQDGFIRYSEQIRDFFNSDFIAQPFNFDVMVPGPATDVSVGIAIGHCKSPLQDLVKEAQKAEKRAKKGNERGVEGRSAFAVSIFKRSGEITQWQTRWDTGELDLYLELLEAIQENKLSNRFPYKLEALIGPYISTDGMENDPNFAKNCFDIVKREFEYCLKQSDQNLNTEVKEKLKDKFCNAYKDKSAEHILHQLPGLLRTVAWSQKH